MPGGIDGVGFSQTSTQHVETQNVQPQSITVQSNGETVRTQPSISSLVADAQEESSMLLQDKSAERLSKRDARSKAASRVREVMQKYLKKVGGVSQTERFEKLAESLKNLAKATPDEVRKLLQQFKEQSNEENFESGLLLALEELFAAEGTHEELLSAVREVKAELGAELQEFYQNHVKSYGDVSEVYQQLLGEYGEGDFLAATEAMIKRLGSDLDAQSGSVDSAKIHDTVESLYNLQVARNAYIAFAGLIEKMETVCGVVGHSQG